MNDDDKKYKDTLTELEYHVLREKGTERAFTGEYWDHWDKGVYLCKVCNEPLFESETKFDAGCGWPSFDRPLDGMKIAEHEDNTLARSRTEVTCSKCESHLGHVFNDGPTETGLRYCINSVSISHDDSNNSNNSNND